MKIQLKGALTRLNKIEICTIEDPTLDEKGIEQLVNKLEQSVSVRELTIIPKGRLINEKSAVLIANAISKHPSLTKLNLEGHQIVGDGAIAFAQALQNNDKLIELNLSKNIEIIQEKNNIYSIRFLSDAAYKGFARLLEVNNTLQVLKLDVFSGCAEEIAKALFKNTSLKCLVFEGQIHEHVHYFFEEDSFRALQAFVDVLHGDNNHTLTTFTIMNSNKYNFHGKKIFFDRILEQIQSYTLQNQKNTNFVKHLTKQGPSIQPILAQSSIIKTNSLSDEEELILSAAKIGDVNKLSNLITQTQGLEICDDEGNTPLMLAILNQKKDVVCFLLKKGANAVKANNLGESSFLLAGKSDDNGSIVKELLSHSSYEGNQRFYRNLLIRGICLLAAVYIVFPDREKQLVILLVSIMLVSFFLKRASHEICSELRNVVWGAVKYDNKRIVELLIKENMVTLEYFNLVRDQLVVLRSFSIEGKTISETPLSQKSINSCLEREKFAMYLESEISKHFVIAYVIGNNMAQTKEDILGMVNKYLTDTFKQPSWLGAEAKLLVEGGARLIGYVKLQYEQKRLRNIANFLVFEQAPEIFRLFSKDISIRYEKQIIYLTEDSMKRFARGIAERIFEYIGTNGHENGTIWYDSKYFTVNVLVGTAAFFFKPVIRKTVYPNFWAERSPKYQNPQEQLFKALIHGRGNSDYEKLATKEQSAVSAKGERRHWTVEGVITRTGVEVKTAKGALLRYTRPAHFEPHYGYRQGSQEEVDLNGFKLNK